MDIPIIERSNNLISSQHFYPEGETNPEIPTVMYRKKQAFSSDSGNSDPDYANVSASCCSDLMEITDKQLAINGIVENYLGFSENEIAGTINAGGRFGANLSEDDRVSFGSRRSSTASEYFEKLGEKKNCAY